MSRGIYKITCIATGQFYIGRSINIQKRYLDHMSALLGNRKFSNPKFQRSFNKYKDLSRNDLGFPLEIIYDMPDASFDELVKVEQKCLDSYCFSELLNVSRSAKGGKVWEEGGEMSQETRKRMSNSAKQRFKKQSEKEAQSERQRRRFQDPKQREIQKKAKKHKARVVIIDGVVYDSVREASRVTQVPRSTIKARCNSSSFENYKWKIND